MKNILYITIFSLLLFTSCKKTSEEKTEIASETEHFNEGIKVTQAQFKGNAMQLGALSKQNFPDLVKTTGTIDVPPQNKAVITSYYAGNVKKSALLIGDKVRKGQALVTIANPEFVDMQQSFLEISEQLNYLKTEYQRQKTLFDEQITSQKSYLKAKSDYDRQKARYNGLHKKLQMLNINPSSVQQGHIASAITLYSPIYGYVTQVNVSKGTYVSPADAIMEIVNTDHIHIELTVFEKDVMKIKEEQKINFKIPEASSETYVAEVHLVGTAIDEETRTVKVHGHLHDEKKHNFAVGMFVDAEIELNNKEALAIPEDALLQEEDKTYILVLETQEKGVYIFKMVEIKTGKKHNGFVEIISENIKPTDKILTKGAYSLVGGEGGGHSH